MHTGTGRIIETYLDGSARIECLPALIPAPGQYLHAHAPDSGSPLPVSVFLYGPLPNGFRAAPPLAPAWTIGTRLNLRGPLGHGFNLPVSARKIALVALDGSPARLQGVMSMALEQNLEVVLACDSAVQGLPEAVEIQPLQTIREVCKWSDTIALDASRRNLHQLKEMLEGLEQVAAVHEAQILIHTPMPCGGLAECGVCAVAFKHGWKMVCRDGPVFLLNELLYRHLNIPTGAG